MIDRSKELEQLYDLVMTRQSVMLYAPSGMGKSHLLSQLYSRLEGRRFCFIFSLRGLQNERQLLRHILDNLLDKAADSYNLQYQLKRVLEERPAPLEVTAESLAGWLKNILVGLQNVSLDFLFVFEDAEQWEGRAPVVELLEALFKARNSQGLLTAAIPIKSLIEEVTPYRLSPITMENLSEKLRQSHPDETLQKTLEISGGNTRFFIELTRSEALQEGLPEEGLREVLENYHPLYYNFRKRFTDLQWRLLLAIAAEGRVAQPHSFDFLVNYRLGAASSVERALRNLSDTGIIHQAENGWRVSQIIFQRWIEWLYPRSVATVAEAL